MRGFVLAIGLALLAGCGPSWAPANAPTRPCDVIDEAAFNAAREAGAAVGRARIYENGTVSLDTGAGVRHCSTFTTAMKVCRRPNDYVVEYTQTDGGKFYVHVPPNTEYRFNVLVLPNTCQIIMPPEFDN